MARLESPETVERELRKRLSRHYRPRDGEDAYDFDIKIHRRIDIPDVVAPAKGFSQTELGDFVQQVMADRLEEFVVPLKSRFPWLKEWFQEGRTGGWLVLVTDEPVLDPYGRLPLYPEGGPKEWRPRGIVSAARDRLRDLRAIERDIASGIAELVNDLENPQWWDIGPKDWAPERRAR